MKSLAIPETVRRRLETRDLSIEFGAASLARQDAIAACRHHLAPASLPQPTSDYGPTGDSAASQTIGRRSRLASAWQALKDNWIWIGPAMVVLVGVFDLACTVSAYEHGMLVEMNPLAKAALDAYGSAGLMVYRFTMTAIGCILLSWGLRMYRQRRYIGSNFSRVRKVMWGGQIALVASHGALVGWWAMWFMYH
jgi:hypothetical protein